jgi:restriction endonuclease S subunit
MRFKTELLGQHIALRKGLSYKGEYLVDESGLGLVGLDAFHAGGGYKFKAEKPYSGPYKPEHLAESGDVLLAMTEQQDGLLASPLIVPEDLGGYEELVFSHHVAKVVAKTGIVQPEFVYNFLRVPINRARAAYGNTGTTVQDLPYDVIYEQMVPVPSLEEQDRINSFIATLDRKIELNAAMSVTLEVIAQSIFRSWFIDFDPVKAKMVGATPVGVDIATAALFPDSMEDSELGPTPKNWDVVPLADLFEILSGGTPKTTEETYWDGEIPWFSVVDAPDSGGCFFIKTAKTITELGVIKSAAKIVRPGITIISARGTVGKTAIVATPSTFNQSCYGLSGKFGDFFTYLLVRNQVAQLQNIAHGGMFDTITRETFSALNVSKPSELITRAFEAAVQPLFMQIRNLQLEAAQLAKIRDSLLPQLISGELQIPEEMLVS